MGITVENKDIITFKKTFYTNSQRLSNTPAVHESDPFRDIWLRKRKWIGDQQINWITPRPSYRIYDIIQSESDLVVELESEKIGLLPYQFNNIYNTIQESKYILKLEDNWDSDGSPSFKKSTWKTAIKFIIKLSTFAFNKMGSIIPTPQIYHSSEGSIDILWENGNYRLLINIPEDIDSPASFYGDDYNLQKIEGTFDPRRINYGILLSLTEL